MDDWSLRRLTFVVLFSPVVILAAILFDRLVAGHAADHDGQTGQALRVDRGVLFVSCRGGTQAPAHDTAGNGHKVACARTVSSNTQYGCCAMGRGKKREMKMSPRNGFTIMGGGEVGPGLCTEQARCLQTGVFAGIRGDGGDVEAQRISVLSKRNRGGRRACKTRETTLAASAR